jgi:hypothetical protein
MRKAIQDLIASNKLKIASIEDEVFNSKTLFPNEDAYLHGQLMELRTQTEKLKDSLKRKPRKPNDLTS